MDVKVHVIKIVFSLDETLGQFGHYGFEGGLQERLAGLVGNASRSGGWVQMTVVSFCLGGDSVLFGAYSPFLVAVFFVY